MRWILNLELLLLFSCIARKWNRAKTFFVRSHSLPKNSFLLLNIRFPQARELAPNELLFLSSSPSKHTVKDDPLKQMGSHV